MGIKGMTGSRTVLEILNNFGHSVNYHIAEELKTTLATNISTTDVSTPDGLNRRPGLATALAWDNIDHCCPMSTCHFEPKMIKIEPFLTI